MEWRRSNNVALRAFWGRRARRLLPALLVLLVFVAVYTRLVIEPWNRAAVRGDGIASLFYVANWRFIADKQGYFELFSAASPLRHTWSLAIEEQFYLVWPLVLVAVLRRGVPMRVGAKRVVALALVLAACSVLLMQLLYVPADPFRVTYGTDTRASAVLLGAALAAAVYVWGPIKGVRGRRALEVAALFAIGMLAVAWTHLAIDSTFLYRGGYVLCGIAVAIVIAASVHPTRGPVAALLSPRALRGLGVISYGVYLWHWPVFLWVNQDRVHLHGWPLFGLQCAIAVAVALVSYRFVERPIRYGWARPGDVVVEGMS
jgi:peptidoglycan/LPS O-acetylase OafA/YrhL